MRRALLILAWLGCCACARPAEEHLRKANVFFSSRRFDDALREFKAAAEQDPKSAAAREGAASVYYELGQLEPAEHWYRLAIEADPKTVTARHKLAVTLAAVSRVPEAILALEAAVEIAPKDPYALSFLGSLYKKQGDLTRAERMQIAALEVQPSYHPARFALANLMIDQKRFADAERQLTTLATEGGGAAIAAYGLARLSAASGHPKDAARYLEQVLASPPSESRRIIDDPAFKDVWSDPALAPIHTRLLALRSSTTATHTQPQH